MLVLRIVAVFAVLAVGALALAWVFTGERRYLRSAWKVLQAALILALGFLLLLFFERLGFMT